MTWRPEGWMNPLGHVKYENDAYEAGASAMLEALRKNGTRGLAPRDTTLVFIPDDDEEEQ